MAKAHRDPNKLTPAGVVLVTLFAIHATMIIADNLGLKLHEPFIAMWVCGILVPMIVAWLVVVIEVAFRPYWPRG
jgi:hypothetical protein